MTNFETEVYNRSADDVIGAKVIVSADNGQTIDSIQVTNKTQFDELKSKLDVLDESYVRYEENSSLAGESIDDLLTNSNEEFLINATRLNGFKSNQFSKTGHKHSKTDISDLYNYDLMLSNYNIYVGDSISLTVKVTKMNNQPVPSHTFSILKNNIVWKNMVTTNQGGYYTVSFTAENAGLTTFSVGNQKVVLNVKEKESLISKTLKNTDLQKDRFTSSSSVIFRKIGRLVIVSFYLSFNNNSTKGEELNIGTIPSEFTPLTSEAKTTWSYGINSGGIVSISGNQLKYYIYPSSTNASPNMRGQLVYFTE